MNRVADVLSKYGSGHLHVRFQQALKTGITCNPVHIWDSCPDQLVSFVQQDLSLSFRHVNHIISYSVCNSAISWHKYITSYPKKQKRGKTNNGQITINRKGGLNVPTHVSLVLMSN